VVQKESMRAWVTACLLLLTTEAYAEELERSETVEQAEVGRDTHRVMVALAGTMFDSYPMSIADPGPALVVGMPFWLGVRHRFFQWVLDGNALIGYGTASKHAHLAVAPQFGFNLYLGPVYGFELRMGPAGILQAGERTVVGLGLAVSGAHVFRFWDDDRRRLKLMVVTHQGNYFADDPGNDLGMNASAFGGALAYETPF
jgi:hypothetical protein